MKPTTGIPESVWGRIPLAKRRLALEGPLDAGTEAVKSACITLASELYTQGVEQDVARTACLAMPFTTGTTSRRDVERQIPRFVAFAYRKPLPLLSGCPTVSESPSPMRNSFSGYCDAECQATCLIRRARTAPEAVLVGTDYYETLISPLWLSGRQGGVKPAKQVWTLLASMAVMDQNEEIQASIGYLVNRMKGTIPYQTLYRQTRLLRDHRLLVLTNSREGVYCVPALSHDELSELEGRLGVDFEASWNAKDARLRQLRRNEEWPTFDLAVELAGGVEPLTDETKDLSGYPAQADEQPAERVWKESVVYRGLDLPITRTSHG